MRTLVFLIIILYSACSSGLHAETSPQDSVTKELNKYFKRIASGNNYLMLSDTLEAFLKPGVPITKKQQVVINVWLGMIEFYRDHYQKSIVYYLKAEEAYFSQKMDDQSLLTNLYMKIAGGYLSWGHYTKALEYTEKSSRIIQNEKNNSKPEIANNNLASIFDSFGDFYYEQNRFDSALTMYNKSIIIYNKYDKKREGGAYFNIATTLEKMGDKLGAKKYYELCIANRIKFGGENNQKLGTTYRYYGRLLLSVNQTEDGLYYYEKAIQNLRKNIGEKGVWLSNTYLLQGNYYKSVGEFQQALMLYQKSLVALSPEFNNHNLFSNPSLENTLIDNSLLYTLNRKTEAFVEYAAATDDKNLKRFRLEKGLETIEPAIKMINDIRVDYLEPETRMFFSDKNRNIYVTGIKNALALYDLDNDKTYLRMAYRFARQSKANELKYEMSRNEALLTQEIPDSLKNRDRKLHTEIADLELLIDREEKNTHPDTKKINSLKDKIFVLNRENEKLQQQIVQQSPVFEKKLKIDRVEQLALLQRRMNSEESLVDYVFSKQNEDGSYQLYTFVVTKNDLNYFSTTIDSIAYATFDSLIDKLSMPNGGENIAASFNRFGTELHQAYNLLIKPVEKYFAGKKLIIVPDGKLAYLPFDVLLKTFSESKQPNFAPLDFLIKTYTISYVNSASDWSKKDRGSLRKPQVEGFAPDYQFLALAGKSNLQQLKEAETEVKNILKLFEGNAYLGKDATRSNFKIACQKNRILHLAMHAEVDPENADLSHLVFSSDNDSLKGADLFNYEIAQMEITSPLVVLSACDTGSGVLHNSEGVISLARNFKLANVPSVVATLWPVEDVAGSKIMERFYRNLSEGMDVDEALRMAKLDYIDNVSPSFAHPRYWASYSLLGDNSALVVHWWQQRWVFWASILFALIIALILRYFSKFFKIS